MKTKPEVSIDISFHAKFTEPEARALVAITRFGIDDFLERFYNTLGKEDLKPNENGLRLLWSTADGLGSQLKYADDLHKMVNDF